MCVIHLPLTENFVTLSASQIALLVIRPPLLQTSISKLSELEFSNVIFIGEIKVPGSQVPTKTERRERDDMLNFVIESYL